MIRETFLTEISSTFTSLHFTSLNRPPDRVLKPGDFPQNRQWRPRQGMGNRNFNPNHVSPGGQRMLRFVILFLKSCYIFFIIFDKI